MFHIVLVGSHTDVVDIALVECFYQLLLTVQTGTDGGLRFYLPRGRAGFAGLNPGGSAIVRCFGAYGWEHGRLRLCLRTPDGPHTLEGSLSWTEARLTFEGTGVGFPMGPITFTRVAE